MEALLAFRIYAQPTTSEDSFRQHSLVGQVAEGELRRRCYIEIDPGGTLYWILNPLP